jgi:hypothetical protein
VDRVEVAAVVAAAAAAAAAVAVVVVVVVAAVQREVFSHGRSCSGQHNS